ncbi:vWA domain-containing protein [Treponema socranskii]|uniref:vWA domain-containing protein n=1 Tax=Treponema socranskii TaxID=53419 RepID=UPI00287219B7|nr:VWA domain-containing protein [Treponema socranskii]MDR9859778.1 VWA domain-containing protein [Treponema socranskii]
MVISCERPYAFYGFILIIPALVAAFHRYRGIIAYSKRAAVIDTNLPESKRMPNLSRTLVVRTLFRCFAWIMLIFAYAGFSWGTYEVPVQRSGSAVSFVFDISYSMTADDAPGGLTRLRAASRYGDMLLSRMGGVSVSVVLAKGEGVIVVPLTEDTAIVRSLLETLSPNLMSAAGTSLGKGIEAALRSFPSDSAQARRIWVFTDGDETDGQLISSIEACVKEGVSVSLIGFGTEQEVEIIAGDGKTKVMTALRSERMKKAVEQVSLYAERYNFSAAARYIDATEAGSAIELLKPLKNETAITVSYEVKPVERYALFLIAAIAAFVLSFVVAEFDFENYRRLFHKSRAAAVVLCAATLLLSSCSARIANAQEIASSSWAWYRKKYRSAIAGFLRVEERARQNGDALSEQYAEYNLAATYIMQSEYAASLACLKNIDPASPEQVRFAAYYNRGIIAYRSGNYTEAAACFRDALRIDGTKTAAKENLEIARRQQAVKEAHEKEIELVPLAQDTNAISAVESAIYQRIRENDQKQWKNSERTAESNSSVDY